MKALQFLNRRLLEMGAKKTDMVSTIRLANYIVNNYKVMPPITNRFKKKMFQAAFDVCKPHFDGVKNRSRVKDALSCPNDFLKATRTPSVLFGRYIMVHYLYYDMGLTMKEITLVFDVTPSIVHHNLKVADELIFGKKENEIKELYSKFLKLLKQEL